MSLAFNKKYAILDGNVKRVLSRYYGIYGWHGETKINSKLWALAKASMDPIATRESARYTQAIMDFGALCCTPKTPNCSNCDLQSECQAYQQGLVDEISDTSST